MANPGMPLLVVEQAGDLIVQASVAESDIAQVKLGDKATVEVKSANETVSGKVIELSPSSYGTGGQYQMKVALDNSINGNIRAGMFANLLLEKNSDPAENKATLWVENNSVIYRDQLTGVYVVANENQAILKWIRLGKENGNQTEVISGLNAEDKIIQQSDSKLYNGKKVIISNR